MMGREKLQSAAEAGLKEAGPRPAEIHLESYGYDLTRFAEGQIHQNISMEGVYVTARVYSGRKRGEVTLPAPGPERVKEAVRRAADALEYAASGPQRPMPDRSVGYAGDKLIGYDERIPERATEWRTDAARRIVRTIESQGPRPFGRVITEHSERLTVNSEGLLSYDPRTGCHLSITAIRGTGYGYSERQGSHFEDVDPERAASEAAGGCNMSRNPEPFPAGDYPVILLPYAVADMMAFIGRLGADGEAVREGRSFMSERMGEKVLSEKLNLWDDGSDPRGCPVLFDGEGVQKQRVDIIRAGVANGALYTQSTAAAEGTKSTGHAPVGRAFGSFRGGGGAVPQNLFLGVGDATVADMIEATDLGLLVTSFHYTRTVEPREVMITGMTRNGTFLVRNGKVVGPVKNLRFTDSYVRALNGVTHVGSESLTCGENVGGVRVPALRLESLRFTGTTEF